MIGMAEELAEGVGVSQPGRSERQPLPIAQAQARRLAEAGAVADVLGGERKS
jgi:hypothetical protein